MEQTSRLSIVVDASDADNSLKRLRKNMQDLERNGSNLATTFSAISSSANHLTGATNATTSGLNRMGGASATASRGLADVGRSSNRASQSVDVLAKNTEDLANKTAKLNGIYQDSKGRWHEAGGKFISVAEAAKRAGVSIEELQRDFDGVSRSASGASGQVQTLGSRLREVQNRLSSLHGLIAGGMFVGASLSIAKTADHMQELNSQVKLVTASHEEYVAVNERLHQMANKNLTDISATTGLYTNSARALSNLGKSQEEILKFTNAVSLAMGVGGKSASEQASAILQLGQAMQSGVLQGDEFRSLAENAPIILDLVAEKLGKTRAEVRELASEGAITSEVIYNALADATPKLQAMFDKMPVTMSQSFVVLSNNYKKFVDKFVNNTTGLSGVVAKSLLGIANNFETLAKGAVAVAGVALVGLASKVTLTTTAFTALKAVMMTHPVLAVATAVLGVSSAFFGLNDVLDTTGLVFGELFGLVKTGLGGLADLAWAVGFNITNAFSDSNDKTSKSFFGFFDNTGKGFLGFLHGVTRIVATMSATFAGFLTWIGNGFWQALRGVASIFIWLKNKADSVVQSMVNGVLDGIDKVIDKVNALIGGANSMLAKTPLEIQIKPISKTSYRYQANQSQSFDLTGKTLSEHIAPWVANANGGVDTMFAGLYSEQAKRNQQAQADSAKATNANTKEQKGKKGKGGRGDKDKKPKEPKQKTPEELAKMREQIELRFMDRYTKAKYELKKLLEEIHGAGFDEKTATKWKQLAKYQFDESQIYHKKSTDLQLNAYRLSASERLKIEKELAEHKINLDTQLSQQEKAIHYQAIEDKYAFDVQQYQMAQQKKVAEFDKAFEQIKNTGHMAQYDDIMNQKRLSPHKYAQYQLDKTHQSNKDDELARYHDVQKAINDKDETGNFVIDDFNERSRLLQEAKRTHEEEMYAITALYTQKTEQLEEERLSKTLQAYGATFGALAGFIKDHAGEQSKAYRAMFAVSKAYALADVGVKMGKAVADAWADPSATTIWQKLANVAKVSLEQGHVLSMINAISPKGFATGGYTGNMGINQVAGVVHGQEYVLNAKATKRIGVGNLERLNRGDGIGGHVNNINVHVTVNSDGSNVQADTQMGKTMGEAMVKIARQVVIQETKQNGHLDRLYRR
ncbi:tape measure protein [Moraxella nonliquefaciens]|uniref:tape measure protein n=1 Tax=Moraxella nonliquefaciens TaxID=478 RepID=UPI001EF4CE88|nr:tape measure protein [Moraxella nonliquefaciens]MCG7412830.1 tape measure protein [Moraxella nonliquefaciens]